LAIAPPRSPSSSDERKPDQQQSEHTKQDVEDGRGDKGQDIEENGVGQEPRSQLDAPSSSTALRKCLTASIRPGVIMFVSSRCFRRA
jgi:hypothetical protein